MLKNWIRNVKRIEWDKRWEKDNGYKDLSKLPIDLKNEWYAWGLRIIADSRVIDVSPKGKYAILCAPDAREQRHLEKLVRWKPLPYPKRPILQT